MKATIPIALQPGTRVLRLERVSHKIEQAWDYTESEGEFIYDRREDGHWILWLHHDLALTQGTFLRLYDDGSIEQITTDADGIEQAYWIKHHD